VDCDFPGGNIIVEAIDGADIRVHQDLRTTHSDWFYWYFRVRPNGHRELSVTFTTSEAVGVRGPAISLDAGRTWRWMGTDAADTHHFRAELPEGAEEVRFSFGMPYVLDDLDEFLARHPDDERFSTGRLTTSEHGRDVQLWRAGRIDGGADHRVLLTCRHHCCEMMASYALEGLVDTILGDSEVGSWLREHVAFDIVPMVDVDGVEEGDQGKMRSPHDHNQDYAEHVQRYAPVRAIRELVLDPSRGPIAFAMDMHCPAISGPDHESIYFVGTPNAANWDAMVAVSQLLQDGGEGPLRFSTSNNMPHGVAWNVVDDPDLLTFARFMDTVPDAGPHATLELPYANASGGEVTAESARAFGHDLARMIRDFLRGSSVA
jgi:hypothetical protein